MTINEEEGFSIKVSTEDQSRPAFDFGADILADGADGVSRPKKKKKKKKKKVDPVAELQ